MLRSLILAATLSLCQGQAAHAASIYWDGAASASWGTAASWSTAFDAATPNPAAEPGANDDVIFNISTNNAIAQIVTLNGNKNALSLAFNNTGTNLLRSSDTNTRVLTLGTGGLTVNSGAGAVTIGAAANGNQISLSGSQTWVNNSSNTATVYNTIARTNGSVLNFSSGSSTFTTTIHSLSNNLVGTWAATGSGTSMRYVTKNGSNVIGAYSAGTAAADASALTSITGTVNYDLADASGITPDTVSANTIRFTGGTGTLAPGATSFTVRGLMNAGTGKWTIGTNPINIGSTNELVIIANSQDTEISSEILNGPGSSAVSYHGGGTLTLSGSNYFTNGLNIGAGKVLINNADALNSFTPNLITFNGTSGTLALNGNDGLTIAGINSVGTATTAQSNQIVENANASPVNLNIGGFSTSSAFYGVLRDGTGGGALGITKIGTGTLTLGGVNTYTGTTTVNEGILATSLSSSLPGNNVSGKVVFNGGTISVRTGDGTTTGWSMAQIDTLVGNATKTSGALGIDTTTGSVSRTTDLNLGVLGLIKLGVNTLTLSTANTYSGPTIVANGELVVQNPGSLGTTTGATTVANGNRLVLDGGITVTGEAATLSGNGTDFFGALRSRSGVNNWTGNITIASSDTRIGALAGSSLEISGVIDSGASAHLITFRPADTTATVIVSGANTYVGPTTLTGGLVTVSSINSVVGGSSSSNLGAPTADNGTIKFGAAEGSGLKYIGSGETTDRAIDLAGTTQGGRIEQSGTGLLKFTSAFTATGAGSKTLTLQGSTAGTGEIGGAIADNSGANKTSLIKAGSGTWTLSGANTYTGTTAVNGGTLKLNYDTGTGGTNDTKLADAGALTLGGGTLELVGGSHPELVASTTLAAGSFSKVIRTGGSAVLKMKAITRNAGASIDFGASGIATTDTTNTNGILGSWATINGTDWAANSTDSADGPIAPYSSYTDLDDDDVIADGATTNVRINSNGGGGSMTLGTSPVTINSLLQNNASQAATINPGTTDTLFTGAIMIGKDAKGLTIGSDADDGILTTATPGGDLLLRNNSTTELLTINSVIANNTSASSLTKLGVGTVVLAGTNTYTGATNLAEGTLKAGGSTAFNNTSALVMTGSSILDLNGYNAAFTNLTATAANTITTTAAGSGTDTLTISALSTTSGALFADNGTRKLAVSVAGASGTPLSNLSNTFSGGLSIGSTVRITVTPGTVGSPGAIVSGPFGRGAITVNGGNVFDAGAQIWFGASNRTLVNDVIVNGNGGMGSRSGTFRIGTNANALTNIGISGNIDANLADAWFGADSTTDGTALLLSGKLTGSRGFRFYVSSNASKWTTTLNNGTGSPNDYAGNTVVNSAPTTLALGAANQIPNGPGKGNVDVTAGTLDLAGFSETINGLIGTGTVDNVATGTSNTLTLGDGNATGTGFSGVIKNSNGTLSLAKIGTGTQTLSGPNAYTGTTTVNGGILHLTGSLATGSAVTVGGASAAGTPTLSGSGTVNGTLTIAAPGGGAAGIVNPGAVGTTGILNAGATTIAGTYACDVNGAATDRLVVTGNLTLGGTLSINQIAPGTPGTYVIATYTGSRIGTLGGTLPSGYSVNYDDTNKEVELVIAAAVPDYNTWGAPYGLSVGSEGGDLDNDGLTNFAEYAFGLLPNSGASVSPISQTLDKSTGLFKYTRRSTTAFSTGVTYTYEYSTTLNGGWTPFTPASLATDNGNPVEEITVGVPSGLLAEPKLFIHVKANN